MTVTTSPSGLGLCDTCSTSSYYQLLAATDPQWPNPSVQPAALQNSGRIDAYDINVELGCGYNATRSLNDSVSRNLAGLPTDGSQISFSSFWGKSKRVGFSWYPSTIVSNYLTGSNSCLNLSCQTGYCAGKSNLVVCVCSTVKIGSCLASLIPSLTIVGTNPGDCVIIYNSGYIMGAGGDGAYWASQDINTGLFCGRAGGIALRVNGGASYYGCTSVTIYNYGHIWGGGGGGGGTHESGGGGGAGVWGGIGGRGLNWCGGRWVENGLFTKGGVCWGLRGDTAGGPPLCSTCCGGGGGGGGGSTAYTGVGGPCVAAFTGLSEGGAGGYAGGAGGQNYDTAYNVCVGGGGGGWNCAAGSGGSGGGGFWGAYGGYANLTSSPGGLPGPAVCFNGSINLNWGCQGNTKGPVCCSNCLS